MRSFSAVSPLRILEHRNRAAYGGSARHGRRRDGHGIRVADAGGEPEFEAAAVNAAGLAFEAGAKPANDAGGSPVWGCCVFSISRVFIGYCNVIFFDFKWLRVTAISRGLSANQRRWIAGALVRSRRLDLRFSDLNPYTIACLRKGLYERDSKVAG
jgi:hypothetical protein